MYLLNIFMIKIYLTA